MDKKICNKCEVEKELVEFEFQKSKNSYRGICKECRNKQRRDKYQENKEEILRKKREYYNNNLEKCRNYKKTSNLDSITRLKRQLTNSINHSFERKGLKKESNYEEILGCNIDEAIEHLLQKYKRYYKKEWDGTTEVDIDHVVPIMYAHTEEQVKKLCHISNLQLLSKKENNRKGGRLSNGTGRNGKIRYVYCPENFFDDDD